MKVSQPIPVMIPSYGVLFAESVHARDFRMAERADAFHKLVYVLDGRVSYQELPKRPRSAEAGTLLIVPRDVRHQIQDLRPSTLLLLCLAGEFLESDVDLPRLWLELTKLNHRQLVLDRPGRHRIENMWRRAMLEAAHQRIGSAVTVRTLATEILVLLARMPVDGVGNESARRVATVVREVEETFYDEWNLGRAALRAGLSRRRFSELFRSEIGRTFWEHLNELRLVHAARLLRAGEHSVLGVMFSCGFNDVTHFYRLFRARHGAPPREWQARAGGKK